VQKNKNPGLIWVLQGKRYSLPRSSELVAKLGQVDTNGSIIAQKQILNNYAGIVKFSKASARNEIRILNFSLILQNAKVLLFNNSTSGKKKYIEIRRW
jgi:hypothetical protein